MNDQSKQFLFDLLLSASPSGFEEPAARIWRQQAETFADEVTVDNNGNSIARLKGDGPKVVIEGHIDEIGLLVSYIDDDGYLWFTPVGGWDDQILTGQRVRIMSANGPVPGVIGRRPAHLLSAEDRGKASKIKELWIDIGATSGEQARERVSIGDPMVIEQPIVDLGNNRIAARGVDNRMGAWIALETLRALSGNRPAADVYAVAAVQEEITFLGARTSAFSLDPDVAVVLDVTHATDHPEADKRGQGDVRVGGGPVLTRGSAVNPRVYQRFAEIARANEIPFAIEASGRSTGTDADAIAPARAGVPTAVISIANRYMHSPNEVISLDDLDAAIRLISLFVADLGGSADFTRQ
ncbi:MAG TPA: M42 family metallopeptidase [Nitrolancea sp.]|nr:M42 family metallopeptidase [Nitrolancea sp.]